MLRDAAVTLIQNRLGQRSGLDTQIVDEMQAAQERLEQEAALPWFLLTQEDIVISASPFALSGLTASFLREVDTDNPLWRQSTTDSADWEPVIKDSYDALRYETSLNGTGTPRYYTLYGDSLYLFTAPDTSYTFRYLFYQKAAVLSSNIENVWLASASGLLVSETGLTTARFLRDKDAVNFFGQELARARVNLNNFMAARETAGRSTVINDRE
jgi:hypothetical protein